MYDDKVRAWIKEVGIEAMGSYLINPSKDKGKVTFEPPACPSASCSSTARCSSRSRRNVKRVQLADAYLDGAVLAGEGGTSNTQQSLLLG